MTVTNALVVTVLPRVRPGQRKYTSSEPHRKLWLTAHQIVNGGTGNPGPLVAFPGAYTGNEPGILIGASRPKRADSSGADSMADI